MDSPQTIMKKQIMSRIREGFGNKFVGLIFGKYNLEQVVEDECMSKKIDYQGTSFSPNRLPVAIN